MRIIKKELVNTKILMFVLFCLISILSSNAAITIGIDSVVFSGKVFNVKDPVINIHGNENNFNRHIKINKNGTFTDTLEIKEGGYYTFRIDKKRVSCYLKPGDELYLDINTDKFYESIKYSGKGALINNYLNERFLLNKTIRNNTGNELYINEEYIFKRIITEYKEQRNELLIKYKNLDADFISTENRYNHYEYLSKLTKYETHHGIYAKKDNYKVPDNFLDELKNLDIDNEKDFDNSSAYASLCISRYYDLSREKAAKEGRSFVEVFINELKKVKSKNIKNVLIKNIVRDEIDIKNKEVFKSYDLLINVIEDKELIFKITEYVNKIKNLERGTISPVFNYKNVNGQDISLGSFKGKFVYIDVWATWCGPCLEEMPSFELLKRKCVDGNIEFITISIDKEKDWDIWKRVVNDKELVGTHLITDKDFKSEFIEKYLVNSIPRYILIDPQGKIIDALAPNPSDDSLMKLFKELEIMK